MCSLCYIGKTYMSNLYFEQLSMFLKILLFHGHFLIDGVHVGYI